MVKCIYKDLAGNKLFVDNNVYYAKNIKGEFISKHGMIAMLKERGIKTKGLLWVDKRKKLNNKGGKS